MNRKRSVNKETKLIRYDIISLSKNIILIHFRYALISLLLKYKIKGYLEVTLTGGGGGEEGVTSIIRGGTDVPLE